MSDVSDSANQAPDSPDELANLRLLQLADSALPIGALAHSFGLETLVDRTIVTNANLADFLRAFIEEAGAMEVVFCRAALELGRASDAPRFLEEWLSLNEKLSARKPGRESRDGSGSLGRNFLAAVLPLGYFPALRQAMEASRRSAGLVHHSMAFGLTCGVLRLDANHALFVYLHQLVASLISSCQRLMPLGQSAATQVLWHLKPSMINAVKSSHAYSVDNAFSFTPLLDWGAMEHPSLVTRLFIS
jgi:urease accessory protein